MSSEEDGDKGEISDVAAVTDVNASKVNGDDSKKEDEKAYKRSSLILEKFKNIRSKEQKLRYKSLSLAKSMVVEPVKGVVGRGASQVRPDAIAGILFDAAEGSAEEVGKVMQKTRPLSAFGTHDRLLQEIEDASTAEDQITAIEETALSMILETKTVTEAAIAATQTSAEASIARLKANSVSTILSIEVTANEAIASIADEAKKAGVDVSSTSASATLSIGQESAMSMAPNDDNIATERRPLQRVFTDDEIETLSLQDIDFSLSDMAPPYIDEDSCLIPGEAIVRVEKAPENSRRIFAGIDIMASVDEVWNILTDYENLQNVVPNLKKNKVVEIFDGNTSFSLDSILEDENLDDDSKVKEISKNLKGAVLEQVGGAKVIGINFSARTSLEVREWSDGMPDLGHFEDEVYMGKSRERRAIDESQLPLKRYHFPRPFAVCHLPHKDISMQSIEKDSGDFRMYQGVWRMQPLPGCAPEGENAMRLTYAVEISPRAILPVGLIENRIAMDLCNNLRSIRDYVQK